MARVSFQAGGSLLVLFLCLLCSCCILVVGQSNEDQLKVAEFDVKPGGVVHEHVETWDDVSCIFTYAAQGGTHEQWLVSLSRSKDQTEYTCNLERPSGISYLFFQHFKLQLKGTRLLEVDAEKQEGSPLSPDEYAIEEHSGSVSSVEGKFSSQLAWIKISGSKPKEEL